MLEVSIVMPIYNVQDYIAESVLSVCKQSFKSFELILVDDGSTDDSVRIAVDILKRTDVEYSVIHQENSGLPAARNRGLNCARGKYVCFIDSDDIINSDHLNTLVALCKKHRLIAAYANFEATWLGNRWGTTPHGESFLITHEQLLKGFLVRKYKIHCCALLIQRSFLNMKKTRFDERLRYGEDIEFMWRLFPMLPEIGCTGLETYKYLQRDNSLMSVQNVQRVLLLRSVFQNTIFEAIRRYPEDSDILRWVGPKASLAFYHTFAVSSSIRMFQELLKQTNYRDEMKSLCRMKVPRIQAFAVVLLISPRLFVYLCRIFREASEKHRTVEVGVKS